MLFYFNIINKRCTSENLCKLFGYTECKGNKWERKGEEVVEYSEWESELLAMTGEDEGEWRGFMVWCKRYQCGCSRD